MSASDLPYSDPAYIEMWDRVAPEFRKRGYGRSRSSMTAEDLRRQLDYLSGAPEMQRAAIEAFKEQQAAAAKPKARAGLNTKTKRSRAPLISNPERNEADLAAIAALMGVKR